jgi:monolysocardiolipin acyltransferase
LAPAAKYFGFDLDFLRNIVPPQDYWCTSPRSPVAALLYLWIQMSRKPGEWQPSSHFNDAVLTTNTPSLFWRAASYQTLLGVATLCRSFLYGLNKTEVHGLPQFLELLQSRANPDNRRRGLLTVSNHVSVMDDPLIWGVLPFSFHTYHGYLNHRWGFGSHDICFKSSPLSHFFSLGQTLPTHRLAHSPWGGPSQPTFTEAVRLLSPIQNGSLQYNPLVTTHRSKWAQHLPSWPRDPIDPFSDLPVPPHYTSQPHDERNYLAPSRYACNTLGWVHIFPEGQIHQTPTYNMRYFKWGVARLILEPPICPDVVPIWIEGTDQIMHESRTFPRFVPRAGKHVSVTFGDPVDTEARFADLRQRWRDLRKEILEPLRLASLPTDQSTQHIPDSASSSPSIPSAHLTPHPHAHAHALGSSAPTEEDLYLGFPFAVLMDDPRVRELWIETAGRVRDEVLALRRARGWPEEDPKASAAQTWLREGPKREGRMQDGSWVGDT